MIVPTLAPNSDAARPSAPRLACRRIEFGDVDELVRLLVRGFPSREPRYWQRALARLSRHAARIGMDTFGHVLESDGVLVGVHLMIYSADPTNAARATRCNVSSWYVEPAFQGYAPLLAARGTRAKGITYFNISPATHVRPVIEARGFKRYGSGRVWCVPALGAVLPRVRLRRFDPLSPNETRNGGLDPWECDLLASHAGYGCLSLTLATADDTLPFIFLPRLTKNIMPSAQLIYCRDIADVVRWSGPIGRFLAKQGLAVVSIDADGPIPGLIGRFVTDDVPKYYKGPAAPRLGDLSNTELVMFGP